MSEIIKFEPSEPEYLIFNTQKQIRVCAYCRVSSDSGEQALSLEAQQRFFQNYFDKHVNWINVGIFSDSGISGTSYKKRTGFNDMLKLAESRKIDLILTKEVSRFSRNLLDTLNITYSLRSMGVYVYFISDGLNTESLSDMADLASIANSAEAESRRTSKRVRWGQKEQMLCGRNFGRRRMFGYEIVKIGDREKYNVISDEAYLVRQIFEKFADGDRLSTIIKALPQSSYFKNGWSTTNILRILKNEKYVGDLKLGKTYTPNVMTHKKQYNNGESFSVLHREHHPESAIIPRNLWDKAQQRLSLCGEKGKHIAQKYWCSSKVVCGCCGQKYISYTKRQKQSVYRAWICSARHKSADKCKSRAVNDKVLYNAVKKVISDIIFKRQDEICKRTLLILTKPNKSREAQLVARTVQIKKKLKSIAEKYVDGEISKELYNELLRENTALYDEAERNLLRLKQNAENTNDLKLKIHELINLPNTHEELFAEICERIAVYNGRILEIKIAHIEDTFLLKYDVKGRGDNYLASFEYVDNI